RRPAKTALSRRSPPSAIRARTGLSSEPIPEESHAAANDTGSIRPVRHGRRSQQSSPAQDDGHRFEDVRLYRGNEHYPEDSAADRGPYHGSDSQHGVASWLDSWDYRRRSRRRTMPRSDRAWS